MHNSSFHVYMQSWFHICAAVPASWLHPSKLSQIAVLLSFAVMDCAVLCFAVSPPPPQPLHPSPKIWAGLLHSLDLIEAWLTSIGATSVLARPLSWFSGVWWWAHR